MSEVIHRNIAEEVVEGWAILLPDGALAREDGKNGDGYPYVGRTRQGAETRLSDKEYPAGIVVKVKATIEVIQEQP
jgi:hypothetical protein